MAYCVLMNNNIKLLQYFLGVIWGFFVFEVLCFLALCILITLLNALKKNLVNYLYFHDRLREAAKKCSFLSGPATKAFSVPPPS